MTRTRIRRLNPAEPCGGRKPASEVTDRALRYRANSEECRPEGPKRCHFCGASKVEVGHFDGDETNTTPENLHWTCRPCNQRIAANMKARGAGRRTKQYNPPALSSLGPNQRRSQRNRRKGATDYREYARALGILDGTAIGDMDSAIALIHSTPMSRRSEFQKDIWAVRKERYGPSGRKDGGAVPF